MAALQTAALLLLLLAVATEAAEPPLQERKALQAFLAGTPHERSLGWNSPSAPSACLWPGVLCDADNATVVKVRLPGVGLVGAIPAGTLGKLQSLRTLSLRSNRLSGSVPADILSLPNLRALYLQDNRLSGAVPPEIAGLTALRHLALYRNELSGEIPAALDGLAEIRSIRLDGNRLSGSIPSLSGLPHLKVFNVSDNQLDGAIPAFLAHFPPESFAGNLGLCGEPLDDRPCGALPPGSSQKKKKLSGPAIAAIAVGGGVGVLLALILLVLCCCFARRRVRDTAASGANGNKTMTSTPTQEARGFTPSPVSGEMSTTDLTSSKEMIPATVETASRRLVFVGGGAAGYSFDLEDLLRASAEVLGKGGAGTTYRAVLEDGATTVVVKRLKDVVAARREFASALEALGRVEHRNLLPVRAYYFSKDERLLVADYLPGGSLSAALHERATECGLLARLSQSGLQHRTSIYADDVVTFLRPSLRDFRAFADIMKIFGEASGLRVNLNKCSAHLISCGEEVAEMVVQELQCPIMPFPMRYLGLPLSLRKLSAAQLQYIADSVGSHLPGWRANLLNRGGRLELVKSTLAAVSVFAMMSLDLPAKTVADINKILRGFLWKGRKEAHGGHCLVAWDRVCMPKKLGGLGIPNLRLLNHALRARWLWLSRTDASKPWNEFNIQVPRVVTHLFETGSTSVVGNGASTFFWTDSWMPAGRIKHVAPHLWKVVPKRVRASRKVREGLAGGWLQDVPPNLGEVELRELLDLADLVLDFALVEGVEDEVHWILEPSNAYSARSAYLALFRGTIDLAGTDQVWRSRAPNKCKFFMWLVLKNRCWTADRLSRRGLPHPASCPFCDQHGEDVDHLLLGCVLSRKVWYEILHPWGLDGWIPNQHDSVARWLPGRTGGGVERRDLWTAITLTCWCLWRHRNGVVFDGHQPSAEKVLKMIETEAALWISAGLFKGSLRQVDKWRVGE